MIRIILRLWVVCLCFWSYSGDAFSYNWPVVLNSVITSCDDGPVYPCSKNVYFAGYTTWMSVPASAVPPYNGMEVYPWVIACQQGDRESGFSGCVWTRSHGPGRISLCRLHSPGSWQLEWGSHCTITTSWGPSGGSGSGGSCVVFGMTYYDSQFDQTYITTPMGTLGANQVANGGNRYCIKPLPPSVKCELNLGSGTVDHGIVMPSSTTVRSITGSVDCGENPSITFFGMGDNLDLGAGVKARLAAVMVNSKTINISSTLTTSGAEPRSYQASTILVVSPW